ncbi:MAG: imidazolonepropionase [Planctomycetota bacterium]|nr:MAG: imidazolonepropionase [Planctomycetota bacterium]
MSAPADLLLTDIAELVPLAGPPAPWRGPRRTLECISDAAVAVRDGRIVAVGPRADVEASVRAARTVSAGGGVVLPGFVDPHTHLPWVGSREAEFLLRLEGKSYADIARAGGGIRATTRAVRAATTAQLVAAARPRLDRMLAHGTTTAEAKSGYGLELEAERRQLEAIRVLDEQHPVDLVATNLAAHEIPDEWRQDRAGWVETLVETILPQLAGLAEFCDVFCEEHVFGVEESRRILTRARELGYRLKLHADELVATGGAELAAELGAVSADHLAKTGPAGIAALAEAGVVAVLLPGTSFYLRHREHAPARAMLEAGVPVALATDLNPGSCLTESMPMILTLACLQLELTPAEAIVAATINAAHAIGRGHDRGSLEVGKLADLVVWDVPTWSYLPTHFGVSLVRTVFKRGEVVYPRGLP